MKIAGLDFYATGVGCDWFSSLGFCRFVKRNEGKHVKFFEKVEQCGRTCSHEVVLVDSEERHERTLHRVVAQFASVMRVA